MSPVREKIKEKLHIGHHHAKEEVTVVETEVPPPDAAHRTAGVSGRPAARVTTPAGTTAYTSAQTPANSPVAGGEHKAAACDKKTFTTVEDRPVEKEVIEKVIEHHPVEKKFVIETRPAGEQELHNQRRDESVGVREEVKKAAPKSSPCEGAPELAVQK